MTLRTILPAFAAAALPFALIISTTARSQDGAPEPRLDGPYTHANLSIYLVRGKGAEGPVPLTLEEALERKVVTVHETGTVSELAVENTGSEDILIHAGDIVKGGQQDRVLTTTMILKPGSGRVPLSAFCVEQGRWAARGTEDVKRFASAKEMMPSREAKLAMKSAVRQKEGTSAGLRSDPIEETANVQRRSREANAQQRVLREPGHNSGVNAQGEVWKNVSKVQAALSASLGAKVNSEMSDSSLQLALENDKVLSARKAYLDALEPVALKETDVIGFVFAINGKINSADIYASNALFRKLWPRLIRASATEALGSKDGQSSASLPDSAAVEAFLADGARGKEQEHEPAKGLKLKVRAGAAATDFETMAVDGRLVHRNVLAH